jgi:hypothetical protein
MSEELSTLPRFVGLSGYSRSGKDTVASFLVAEYGYRQIAFADRLRALVVALFPSIAEIVNGAGGDWEKAKENPEVKRVLQGVGEAVRKNVGPDVWVVAALSPIRDDELVVVSDARYLNEADAIVSRGGTLLRIERPGTKPFNNHVSETALDRYDGFHAVLVNDSTLEVLHGRVRVALSEMSLELVTAGVR